MMWSLQCLRFIAALLVVYVHAAQTAFAVAGSPGLIPRDLSGIGLSGVDIFFVLSGVVITKTARGLSPAEFAKRRLRRIVPFYWACCIPYAALLLTTDIGWREALATFLLWPATDVMTAPMVEIAWTLCFEMLFYSACALILNDRRFLYPLILAYGVAFALRPFGPIFQFLGNPIILEFFFGVLIACAPMRRVGIWGIPLGVLALISAGLLGHTPTGQAIDFLTGENAPKRVMVFGIPAAFIVYGTMQVRARESIWSYLGDTSYCLYLTHVLIVTALFAIWRMYPARPEVIVIVGVLASVLLAWRVHERFEKPILRALGKPYTAPIICVSSLEQGDKRRALWR